MKLEIWTPKATVVEPVRVKLVQHMHPVDVISVKDDGKTVMSYLASLTAGGQIYKHGAINPDLGFDLDSYRRIKVVGDDAPKVRVKDEAQLRKIISEGLNQYKSANDSFIAENIINRVNEIFEAVE